MAKGSKGLKGEAFYLISSRGRFHWLQKVVCFYRVRVRVSLFEDEATSHLINYLSKHLHNEFMFFKSYSIQLDIHLVNYSPIILKYTIKQGMLSDLLIRTKC